MISGYITEIFQSGMVEGDDNVWYAKVDVNGNDVFLVIGEDHWETRVQTMDLSSGLSRYEVGEQYDSLGPVSSEEARRNLQQQIEAGENPPVVIDVLETYRQFFGGDYSGYAGELAEMFDVDSTYASFEAIFDRRDIIDQEIIIPGYILHAPDDIRGR
jgi:hypothetical protein